MQKIKKIIVAIAFLLAPMAYVSAQPSIMLKTLRPPELEVSKYKRVAIGDIVGSIGEKSEQSLDLSDALSSRLFNAGVMEVIDRNALDKIMGDQKYKDLQVIDEKTTQMLNRKLNDALFITGRIQTEKLEQKLIYDDQSIVVNGCSRKYFYQVKGDVRVQVKILDLSTGQMIFNDVVIRPVNKETSTSCTVPEKLDVNEILRASIQDLSEDIAKLMVPYESSTQLRFNDPGLFKSPFKQLQNAIGLLQAKSNDAALAIFKSYTEDKKSKSKILASAQYNYGLALLYTAQYAAAKTAFETSASLNSTNMAAYATLYELIDKEQLAAAKIIRLAAEKQKIEEAALTNISKPVASQKAINNKPAAAKQPAKATSKTKN